ncbi:MAG: hypothetical protein EBR94_06240, partial [Bacteroidetes bacterium]|nr:hypothetical protein [Bacteroidota bacterium]
MALIYNGQTISYGNGSTSLTVNASTPGIVGTVYSLTASTAYYINVTIDAGYTLKINRTTDFRVSGTLTINGTIQQYDSPNGGNNAPAITGGSGTGGGGGGGHGSAGNPGTGGRRNGGSAPGGAIYVGNGNGGITYYSDVIPATYNGGAGQWGQGGDGGTPDNAGGGMYGSGASSFKIIAKNIVHGSAAKIYAYGDNGSTGSTNYGSGQGGGGGGGGGGG